MRIKLCFVAAFIAGLLFTVNPKPTYANGKGTAVVVTPLHFDAAETACVATLPNHSETMPTLFFTEYVAVAHPDSKTVAGNRPKPPKKWEYKGVRVGFGKFMRKK